MIQPIYIFLLVALVVSVTIAMLVLPNILLISHKKKLFDMPDKRKVHHAPIPRLGGLSFFPVMLITMGGLVLIYHLMGLSSGSLHGEVPYEFLALLVGSMMLFLVGLADDLIGVGYKKKFIVQILAASLLVASGVWIKSLDGLFGIYQLSPWVGMPFTVLIVVYVTNAINLIDGIDGLASGLCGISLVRADDRDDDAEHDAQQQRQDRRFERGEQAVQIQSPASGGHKALVKADEGVVPEAEGLPGLQLRRQVGVKLRPITHVDTSFFLRAKGGSWPPFTWFAFWMRLLRGNILVDDGLDGAVRLELGQRLVQGFLQRGVVLSHADGVILVGVLGV